ncbi:hypothetical protein [Flavilitoribacter nigricans]|uniref:Uncharacterized protein n=1 Tax=Flavilitoribacter nigricans (strain ATCC 23147 / DSM 23189 / NBRC 102662 / NCIMB 1420 / SS-2) TaxID=1122177 RepID=A0A2D0N6F6_FLAN2|nr:hypothetical protein [Flavilitoribacter nigricans]PHN04075.1 hypothetical protein CRP01_23035 [Flavilitoribacter nigricans DSM 23189 = NBRC 102662]
MSNKEKDIEEIKLQTFRETVKFLKRYASIPPNGVIPYNFFVESGFDAEKALRLRDEYSRKLDKKYGLDDIKKSL